MYVTTCSSEWNWTLWGQFYSAAGNRLAIEKARKLICIRMNAQDDEAAPVDNDNVRVMLKTVELE